VKRIKTLFAALIILCFVSLFSFSYAADNTSDVVVSLKIYDPIMKVNGIDTEIDEGRGTSAVIENSRTLVPIRAIIESFGGSVGWDNDTRSVTLKMGEDTIILIIDSTTAYLNDDEVLLDVAPAIINERTMLPLRFIAESFNLGVAWDGDTKTVSVIRDTFNEDEYGMLMEMVPDYSGEPYAEINDNIPFFEEYEIIGGSFEYYSYLDELDRCNVCISSVAEDIMPTEERGEIGSVKPTGWHTVKYDVVDGKYLYNRCHLIGFQLTGENANKCNLITGTRYMNVTGMLPFENMVADYVEDTGNHVMYRVTPVFTKDNLLADGVLMEAYSVEDGGAGLMFCVFCYNVQPYIMIDYETGQSMYVETDEEVSFDETEDGVYRTPSGKKYHNDAQCGGKNSYPVALEEALNSGLEPCEKCVLN